MFKKCHKNLQRMYLLLSKETIKNNQLYSFFELNSKPLKLNIYPPMFPKYDNLQKFIDTFK